MRSHSMILQHYIVFRNLINTCKIHDIAESNELNRAHHNTDLGRQKNISGISPGDSNQEL